MKKFIISFLVLLLCLASVFAWTGNYSIKCRRCIENTKNSSPTDFLICHGCPTWRCYGHEPKGYMVYRCPHGHELYIKSDCDKKSQDLSEVFYLKNGKLVPVTEH